MQKILVILGPTATGKSDLAVKLALAHNGEVISADSRQVYTGLDLGTGKITRKEMRGVPHHLLDVCSSKKRFDVAQWQTEAQKIISDIHARGKLPIICGGTGFYIRSIVENIILPDVAPNTKLREKLEKKTLSELVAILRKLDPERLKTIDTQNAVRLIRAIEIATELGSVPKIKKGKVTYDILQIGLTLEDSVLKQKIHDRILSRIKKGMVREATNLHHKGVSWKRMQELGLEYRFLALLLLKKINRSEFITQLETAIWQYVRRQKQWFGYDKSIKWFAPTDMKKIEKEVNIFLFS